jgi:hypothetical protein
MSEPKTGRGPLKASDLDDQQLLIMALAHLSIERPGFDNALNRLALKFDRDRGDGRAKLYEGFRSLHQKKVERTKAVK